MKNKDYHNSSLIFTAYANLDNASTGANIKNYSKRSEIYYKNVVVALVSAKKNNPECDVALFTNQTIPHEYHRILTENEILIIICPFETFKFNNDYPWSLAYYKLCALKKSLEYDYDNYLMIDSDVFVQNNLSKLWAWTPDYLVVYDTNETTERWQNEMHAYLGNNTYVTHWGGEFIAGSHEILKSFIISCESIYKQMKGCNFITIHGDEFIESIAIHNGNFKIKHAEMFMYRFWTRTIYHTKTVSPVGGINVLHVPAEKEYGMVKLYRIISSKKTVPTQRKAQNILHLHGPAVSVAIRIMLKRMINAIKK